MSATARGFARTGLTWDERSRRYRDARGRFLSPARVQAILEEQIVATGARMRAAAEELQAGRISLAEWQLRMEGHVKRLHLMSVAVERGGFAQMSTADFGWAGAQVRRQYEYLRGFAREIERGYPLDGRFLQRVSLYAEAGRGTMREAERRRAMQDGMTEEKNLLSPKDYCRASKDVPGCYEESQKGWVRIGQLARIGSRRCRTRCRCRLAFRKGEEAA